MDKFAEELRDAEDFFSFYNIPYDVGVVRIARLHILKRFRQYLERESLHREPSQNPDMWEKQRALLLKAYKDFVYSSPLREKVFPVFHQGETTFIPLSTLKKGDRDASKIQP